MAEVKELLRVEEDGSLSFGNDKLPEKTKKNNVEYKGGICKVKTYREITRLEKDDVLVFESVPGTIVHNLDYSDSNVKFLIEGSKDAGITLGMKPDTMYAVSVDGAETGMIRASMSGKLSFAVELEEGKVLAVAVQER